MIKVLYYTEATHEGGVTRHIESLIAGLDPACFAPIVVCFARPELLSFIQKLIRANARVYSLKVAIPWGLPKMFFHLCSVLRREQPQILHIHLHLFFTCILSFLAGKFLKVPFILHTEHQPEVDFRNHYIIPSAVLDKKLIRVIRNIQFSISSKIIAVSQFVKEQIIKRYEVKDERIIVIYNGIDSTDFTRQENIGGIRRRFGLYEGERVVGAVGNLFDVKGFNYLLEAAAEVIARDAKVSFLIAGDGREGRDLRSYAKKLGIDRKVKFTGYLKEINALYSIMDVFVLSSIFEGLPYTLLEAMAIGVPVVATAVGGVPEVITSERKGILVAPRDPHAIAEKILFLLQHPETAKQMASRAAAGVREHFSLKAMIGETTNVYQERSGSSENSYRS